MQRAARELNLSESVFLELAGDRRARRASSRRRPSSRSPGTRCSARASSPRGWPAPRSVEIQTARGAVPVNAGADGRTAMVQPLARRSRRRDARALLAALGVDRPALAPAALRERPAPRLRCARRRERARGTRARHDRARTARRLARHAVRRSSATDVSTRTFLPALGVNEDPATGSAAGPLAVHLCRNGARAMGHLADDPPGRGAGAAVAARSRCGRRRPARVLEVRVRGQVARRRAGTASGRAPRRPSLACNGERGGAGVARYKAQVAARGGQHEVFEYLADFSNAKEWDPSVKSAERLDTGEIKVGSTFRLVSRVHGAHQRAGLRDYRARAAAPGDVQRRELDSDFARHDHLRAGR